MLHLSTFMPIKVVVVVFVVVAISQHGKDSEADLQRQSSSQKLRGGSNYLKVEDKKWKGNSLKEAK